ncbi:hypothetical protein HF325_003566 [Metschnikowia pulcherrima]|uniref:TauD/TfdA-like domain-containing protein n=1 Tax=Metschnikowia pulcherrima TaxID=27326 RepID=A0A8H7GUH5_9ASCO|nr:hypothetical protein HF325_003566 [Metschnikowia pulcherrima]
MPSLTDIYDKNKYTVTDIHFHDETDEVDSEGVFIVNREGAKESQFPEYLPSWDPKQKFPRVKFFEHQDPGLRADPSFPNLFPRKGEQIIRITPKLGSVEFERTFAQKTNNVGWHSDISYELQPPGTTFFAVLEGPEAGGDTIFADTVEAYKRLSPEFQKRLEGLHVLHSSYTQSRNSVAQGGIERRKPAEHIHPLIRIHPVTKEKAIYVNRPFTKRIVELKDEESEHLLNFLYKHIESAHDLQLRAKWEPNTVVVWDNRRTVHSAIVDWDAPVSRHAVRVTPQAERPTALLEQLNRPNPEFGDLV